jgi:hypothetical protein
MKTLEYAERIAYSSKETLHFTYEMAKKYADYPGVYCETGVAAGAQIIAMASGAPSKKIFAFDSFQGLPLPSNRDDQMPGIRKLNDDERKQLPDPGKQVLESSGATSVPVEDFLGHLKESGIDMTKVIAVKGWFENTVAILEEDISILRLDGDLYNSTWVCLQHLFPKVLKGGCVIIDDWNLKGCQDACKEYFTLIGYEPEYKFISDIAYFIK